jgi:CRISPR type III-A-associated RAMP protein Csm4
VRWKGAKFVPLSVVISLVNRRAVSEEGWTVDGASECLVPLGAQGPFRVSVRSSAAVDRWRTGVAPHSSACLEFAPQAGLWTVAAFASDEARARWDGAMRGAFRLLADSGFGGERSRGWGRASVEFSDQESLLLPFPEITGEAAWWMLSLFHPGASESIDWQRGNYALVTRGGRVESETRWGDPKKPTRMVAEGSVIVAGSQPMGQATDVAPEGFPHPVYRAGFALAIPVPWRPAS